MSESQNPSRDARTPEAPTAERSRRRASLTKLLILVAIGHAVAIVALSPGLWLHREESVEEVLKRGEEALAADRLDDALRDFNRVLDKQPPPAPIFVKAADLARQADRLRRQRGPATVPADVPALPSASAAPPDKTANTTTPAPTAATKPARPTGESKKDDFVPPELRGK